MPLPPASRPEHDPSWLPFTCPKGQALVPTWFLMLSISACSLWIARFMSAISFRVFRRSSRASQPGPGGSQTGGTTQKGMTGAGYDYRELVFFSPKEGPRF